MGKFFFSPHQQSGIQWGHQLACHILGQVDALPQWLQGVEATGAVQACPQVSAAAWSAKGR